VKDCGEKDLGGGGAGFEVCPKDNLPVAAEEEEEEG